MSSHLFETRSAASAVSLCDFWIKRLKALMSGGACWLGLGAFWRLQLGGQNKHLRSDVCWSHAEVVSATLRNQGLRSTSLCCLCSDDSLQDKDAPQDAFNSFAPIRTTPSCQDGQTWPVSNNGSFHLLSFHFKSFGVLCF